MIARGFTLLEVLIVVVILGILAAMTIPQFTAAADDAKLSSLQTNLGTVRGQLQLYKIQHDESLPTSVATFAAQMTTASKEDGSTAALGTSGYNYGPYLQSIPNNPYTDGDTVGSGGVGTSDWYYDSVTGAFRANDTAENAAY